MADDAEGAGDAAGGVELGGVTLAIREAERVERNDDKGEQPQVRQSGGQLPAPPSFARPSYPER